MVLLDDRGCHVEVNGAYLRLVGYRRATLIGHPLHEVMAGGSLASPGEWKALLEETQLHISHHTVRTHVRNAMIKLGVRSRAQLVARALGDGIALR